MIDNHFDPGSDPLETFEDQNELGESERILIDDIFENEPLYDLIEKYVQWRVSAALAEAKGDDEMWWDTFFIPELERRTEGHWITGESISAIADKIKRGE